MKTQEKIITMVLKDILGKKYAGHIEGDDVVTIMINNSDKPLTVTNIVELFNELSSNRRGVMPRDLIIDNNRPYLIKVRGLSIDKVMKRGDGIMHNITKETDDKEVDDEIIGNHPPLNSNEIIQPLDIDTIREMKNNYNNKYSNYTQEEQNRAICTHKDPDKRNDFSLIEESDGTSTCYICGANFLIVDYTQGEIEMIANSVLNIVQNIKTMDIQMSLEDAMLYKDMILYIRNLAKYYERACDAFNSYDRSILPDHKLYQHRQKG